MKKFRENMMFVIQKTFKELIAYLLTNYQRNFRKFSENRFFSSWENLNRTNKL